MSSHRSFFIFALEDTYIGRPGYIQGMHRTAPGTPTNYFRAGKTMVFFDDRSYDATERAFSDASRVGGPVWVYRRPPNPGLWSEVNIIGHRPSYEIQADIGRTTDKAELIGLGVELGLLTTARGE